MIILEDLPYIESGTVKQQMFAEDVRVNFISLVEEFYPEMEEDALNLIRVRTYFKWWIDQRYKMNPLDVKKLLSASRSRIKRHGSVEAVIAAEKDAAKRSQEYLLNSRILGGILDEK